MGNGTDHFSHRGDARDVSEICLCFAQGFLRFSPVVQIGDETIPFCDATAFVPERQGPRQAPSESAIRSPMSKFHLKKDFLRNGGSPTFRHHLQVVRVYHVTPTLA